jgi:hypothetical protein
VILLFTQLERGCWCVPSHRASTSSTSEWCVCVHHERRAPPHITQTRRQRRARDQRVPFINARGPRSLFSIHSTQFTFGGLFLSLHAPHYTLEPMCPRLYGAIARASQNKHPTSPKLKTHASHISRPTLCSVFMRYAQLCAPSGHSVHLNHEAVWIIAHAKSRGGPKRDAPLRHLTLILHSHPIQNYIGAHIYLNLAYCRSLSAKKHANRIFFIKLLPKTKLRIQIISLAAAKLRQNPKFI